MHTHTLLAPGQKKHWTPKDGRSSGDAVKEVPDDSWQVDGLCNETDPELFFPEKGEGSKIAQARKVCGNCDVLEQCREWALAHPARMPGIWGGMTERERRLERSVRRGEAGIPAQRDGE